MTPVDRRKAFTAAWAGKTREGYRISDISAFSPCVDGDSHGTACQWERFPFVRPGSEKDEWMWKSEVRTKPSEQSQCEGNVVTRLDNSVRQDGGHPIFHPTQNEYDPKLTEA